MPKAFFKRYTHFIHIRVPGPQFSDGTLWLLAGFLLMNLLVWLEVADRLSLKRGLERTLALYAGAYQQSAAGDLGRAVFEAVERHRRDQRLADDLTVLVLSRLAIPVG